jgi:hypothetical protein
MRLLSKELGSRESVMILTILDNNGNLTLSDIRNYIKQSTYE